MAFKITGVRVRELDEGFLVTLDREKTGVKEGEDNFLDSLEFAKDTEEEAIEFAGKMLGETRL